MEHAEAERMLALYADNELDAMAASRLETHLRGCEACAACLDTMRRNRSVLTQALGRAAAPESLRKRILDDLGAIGRLAASDNLPSRDIGRPAWMRYAASIAASAVLASGATLALMHASPVQPLAATVFNEHIRALTTHQMIEIAGTQARPVQAWFQGRLSFAPPVADLANKGLSLIGGRVDYIDGQPVAAVVYGRGRHLVSLFVRPAPEGHPTVPASAAWRGFACVHWGGGGFEYWAVSDVPAMEMKNISRLLGNRLAA